MPTCQGDFEMVLKQHMCCTWGLQSALMRNPLNNENAYIFFPIASVSTIVGIVFNPTAKARLDWQDAQDANKPTTTIYHFKNKCMNLHM